MKSLSKNITDILADAALFEMGVNATGITEHRSKAVAETLEKYLIEVAFAEVADYDDIHREILREHQTEMELAYPDDCQYGDNKMCYVS
jgi:hypothetical protein